MQKSQITNEVQDSQSTQSDFEPSMKVLQRIMKFIAENVYETKTSLALYTNLNYSTLLKHVIWLEKKGLVKSIVKDGRVKVALTRNGITFASTISKQ